MKKFLSIMTATLLMTTSIFAAGDTESITSESKPGVNVTVNGIPVDMEGVIVEGRTMVPVRGVFENIGYTVNWNAETKTATLTKGSTTVEMTNGNTYFIYNGIQITPDVPQQIIDGRFMLPLRAVGEALNATVDWNAETKTASITVSSGLKIGNILNLD